MANGEYQIGQRFKSPAGDTYEVIGIRPDGSPRVREVTTQEDLSSGFARTVAQGATFGLSDELRGVGRGLKGLLTEGGSFAEDYRSGRQAEQSALQKYRDQAGGGAALLAEGLGGLAVGFGAPALLRGGAAGLRAGASALRSGQGLRRASQAAQVAGTGAKAARAAQLSGTGGGISHAAIQAGKIGALEGGIYGAAAADADEDTLEENINERITGGLLGAVTGGGLGGVMGGTMQAVIPKAQTIFKGLRAGRLGTGSVAEGAGSALDMAQEVGDLAIAKQIRDEVNSQAQSGGNLNFRELADEWASKVNKNSKEYKKYLESEDSELFGGLMALAKQGLHRKSTLSPAFLRTIDSVLGDTSGGRLLATLNDQLETTAVVASGAAGGKGDPVRFLRTNADANAEGTAAGLLGDLKDATGAGRVGRQRATAESIDEAAKTLTNKEYSSLYDMSDVEFNDVKKALLDTPEGRSIIEDLTNAMGPNQPLGGELVEAQLEATRLAYVQALNAKPQNKALIARLKDGLDKTFDVDQSTGEVFRRVIGASNVESKPGQTVSLFGTINPDGTVTPPDLRDLNIEQVDVMRRALRDLADAKLTSPVATTRALGAQAKTLLSRLDNVVDNAAPKYGQVRQDFGARREATRAYGKASEVFNQNEVDVKTFYDTLSDVPVRVGRTQEGVGRAINRSEKQMFRQGILDNLADQVQDAADEGAKVEIIDKAFKKYFDPPNGVFVGDLSSADIKRLRDNLVKGKRNLNFADSLNSDSAEALHGAVMQARGQLAATAFGYALAGQPGAGARTGIASMMYGPGMLDNVSNAFAKRLGQQTKAGLLDVADNIVKQEAKTVQELARRQLLSAATGAAGTGLLQSLNDPERFRRRR